VPKADNLPPSCAVVTKSGNLNFLELSGPFRACNGTTFYKSTTNSVKHECRNVGNGDTVTVKPVGEKCLVLGDSTVRNVGAEKPNIMVECFPGIRADQLRRVMENRDFGHSDAVVIHVGTNDVRRSRNLDNIMGEVYDLVNTAKAKFPSSRLVPVFFL